MDGGTGCNYEGLLYNLARLEKGKLAVAFFINNSSLSQDEWMNPMAETFREMGFFTIGLVTPHSKDNCTMHSMDVTAVIDPGQLAGLERINAFIISDYDMFNTFPQASAVIGCVHAFETMHDTAFNNQMMQISYLDAFLIPFPLTGLTREAAGALWTGFASKEACFRQGERFTFIPAAYPRMTVLANKLEHSDQVPDSILYAPMTPNWALEHGGERIKKYGKGLIERLLYKFPSMNVIFRPQKADLAAPCVLDICGAFANEPRFILDDNPGRLASFSRAAALITDLSHIGKTFAYAALRPAFYYQPWLDTGRAALLAEAGYTVSSLGALCGLIRDCLANPGVEREKLRQLRDTKIIPFANGFEETGRAVKDLCEGRTRETWLTVNRFGKTMSDYELLRMIMPWQDAMIPAAAARLRRPSSPLILAYAIHTGLKYCAETSALYGVGCAAAGFFGKKIQQGPYKDTEPGLVPKLYAASMKNATKHGTHRDMALIRELWDSFQDEFPQYC